MIKIFSEPASSIAASVDFTHNLITFISVFFTVAVTATMVYYVIKYRRRNGVDHETPRILSSHILEVVWTVVPTILSAIVAYYGIIYYREMRIVPDNAMTINVWGQKWFWDFTYENGKKVGGKDVEIVIPVNKPVRLVLQSRDVLHSFFIPSMRVKKDAVPGQYSYISFTPIKTGTYPVFCTEYCGKEHYNMMVQLRVVSEDEFMRWINDDSDEVAKTRISPAALGKQLYQQKACSSCHSLDGSRIVGPSFLKLYGEEQKLSDGKTVVADDAYIRESIEYPQAKIVESYPPAMPSFKGQLTDAEIDGLIAFIKSSKDAPVAVAAKVPAAPEDLSKLTPAQRGERLYKTAAVPACSSCHTIDGSRLVGPSFKGLYGSEQPITGGTKVTADDAYIHESIVTPMAKVVEGYAPAMPPYAGSLKDDQIADIIEYLKTLK